MRNLNSIILIISVFIIGNSCKKEKIPDDELSLSTESYTGSQIKIDGYWYILDTITNNETWFYDCTFFYANGTVFGRVTVDSNNLANTELDFRDGDFYKQSAQYKYCWGKYIIDNENIAFEMWYPGEGPLRAYVRKGVILNDTTFQITNVYREKNGVVIESRQVNEVYHFKEFYPKPDSTNNFIN